MRLYCIVKIIHITLLFGLLLRIDAWTEQDEARRIQQLNEAEELEFELEQSSQLGGQPARQQFASKIDNPSILRPTTTQQAPATINHMVTTRQIVESNNNWCYHCASPLNAVSGDMRRAIEKFLKLRRTMYPVSVKNDRCSEPRNLSDLATEQCQHAYCQTLILTDHDTGSSFTMRGCAETFGAINEELLDERGDNTCLRLHDQLDIQECICRHRKYCYPGAHRSLYLVKSRTSGVSRSAVSIYSLLLAWHLIRI